MSYRFQPGRHSFKQPKSRLEVTPTLRRKTLTPDQPLNEARAHICAEEAAELSRYNSNDHLLHKPLLTETHCSLLRVSWRRVGKYGLSGIGVMIFKRLFHKRPEAKVVFGYTNNASMSQIQYEPAFEHHSEVIIEVLNNAIEHLDNLDLEFAPELIKYGKNHAHLRERGFKPDMWDDFAEAMTDSAMEWTGLGGGGRHRETIRAWTILVAYIVDKIRFGYDIEVRRLRRAEGGFSYPGTPRTGSPIPPPPEPILPDKTISPFCHPPRVEDPTHY